MVRLIGSVVAGLALALALVFITDAVFHQLSTVAAPIRSADTEAMRLYVAGQPIALLTLILLGWTLAAFAGAALAARTGQRGAQPGWIAGALFLVVIVLNFAMVPHPVWMVVVGIIAIVVAGWLGGRMGASSGLASQVAE